MHLLTARRHHQRGFQGYAVGQQLVGHECHTAHVFVAAVGAATNQRIGQIGGGGLAFVKGFYRVAGQVGGHLAGLGKQVGAVGPNQARLQVTEVDVNHQVIIVFRRRGGFRVRHQVVLKFMQQGDKIRAPGHLKVGVHTAVVGEDAGGGAKFRTHVANGRFAGGRDSRAAGAKVFNYAVGAAFAGQNVQQLLNHIFRRGPAFQLAGQAHTHHVGVQHFPRQAHHHVHRICATYAAGKDAKATGIGGVAVGAQHHQAGEGVLFKGYLVNDTGAGLPKAKSIALAGIGQKGIDLGIFALGHCHVGALAFVGAYQVVAVHGYGHGGMVFLCLHELQNSHLRGGILQNHAVGVEFGVGFATGQVSVGGIVQVAVENLLGQRQRAF